jgi:transcriptional regulator with XRE-family HTH domain
MMKPRKNNLLPSGRRYKSVAALMEAQNTPGEIREEVQKLAASTRVVDELCRMRTRAGLTQAQIAERIGCTQSRISKMEGSIDRDLSLGEIFDYVKATGSQISIGIGKPLTHVQSVKAHAAGIRKHLRSLADLAKKHDELEPDIQAFFGEAFFNLLKILSECQGALERERVETELEVFSQREESGASASEAAVESRSRGENTRRAG